MPQLFSQIRKFFIFAVPVVPAFPEHNTATVGLDPIPIGIQPNLAGTKTMIHIFNLHR